MEIPILRQISNIPFLQYRNFDGSCNNQINPQWGKSGIPYKRQAIRKFTVRKCGLKALGPFESKLPNPRLSSRLLTNHIDKLMDSQLSMLTMVFGQVLDHGK